jgi:hypothetical protein
MKLSVLAKVSESGVPPSGVGAKSRRGICLRRGGHRAVVTETKNGSPERTQPTVALGPVCTAGGPGRTQGHGGR